MNRTDRLYGLVEELRARAPRLVPAAALAQRFEVTTRTIERDLLALQQAGVPIWAQPGPGGGYGINVQATLPPLNLTPSEAAAVAIALAAAGGMPLATVGRTALKKVAAVMASAPRSAASELVSRVRVADGAAEPAAMVSEVIERALLDPVVLDLKYLDREGRETARKVEPVGMIATPSGWYLAAWCRLRAAPRFFRLDRMSQVALTSERVGKRSLDEMLVELPFEMAEPTLT